jgi:hypothetical protein
VLFMTVALLSFVSFSSVPQYIEQRSIYNRCLPYPSLCVCGGACVRCDRHRNLLWRTHRERAAGMYHAFSYFISKTVVGFTLLAMLVCVGASLYLRRALLPQAELTHTHTHTECSIIYWMVGLRDAPVYHFFFFVFIVLLTSWAGEVPSAYDCFSSLGMRHAHGMTRHDQRHDTTRHDTTGVDLRGL